jgi:predicted N-formylglutamate amidohydrolase
LGYRCSESWGESNALLNFQDPEPCIVLNRGGASPFLLLGDHAGRAIPAALDRLGLPSAAMDRHIAWDIGIAGLGERLSTRLDACFVSQAYSRLVIDCNRRPESPDAIPGESDGQTIPGNLSLTSADRAARRLAIYDPYQNEISRILDARADRPTILVSLHSFTPVWKGQARPWRYGVLHRGDSSFSQEVLEWLRGQLGDRVGDNQPYAMDGIDNTIPLHADARALDYLELEVRQDLIETAGGQDRVAELIAGVLERVMSQRA